MDSTIEHGASSDGQSYGRREDRIFPETKMIGHTDHCKLKLSRFNRQTAITSSSRPRNIKGIANFRPNLGRGSRKNAIAERITAPRASGILLAPDRKFRDGRERLASPWQLLVWVR